MTEAQIQRAVFDEIKARAFPGVVAWAVPNNPSARRTVGFKAGVHDVSIVFRGEFFSLELKKEDGDVSDEQLTHQIAINDAGGHAYVAYGFDDALAWLEAQGILRRAHG